MSTPVTLLWFRQDLRLQDNPALTAALARGVVIPVYIHDAASAGPWTVGAAARWWLHHSLAALGDSLDGRDSRLILRQGDSVAVLRDLIEATGATAVYWNRRYEPAGLAQDRHIKAELTACGLEARSFNAALLHEPHTVANKSGGPFQVFTPFWRHCLALPKELPVNPPKATWRVPARWPRSDELPAWQLRPRLNWADAWTKLWQPGEAGAQVRLKQFIASSLAGYSDRRDRPAEQGTSGLSPHLHFGEIGPRQVWAAVEALSRESGVFPPSRGAQVFLSEIGWREFAHHLLFHFPQTPAMPLREQFARFPWERNERQLAAWQRGRTGYPIVDAGMRQLWKTGWMHNRVRMIVASFLVKHLRISWQEGASWFWDTLVDADLAGNTLGWQWSAGCGADAAPYFRIFNPVLQGKKFDPEGDYVRRWVPELSRVPARHIHAPWLAPVEVLTAAGVGLARDYPRPVVDHAAARAAALAAFKKLRN